MNFKSWIKLTEAGFMDYIRPGFTPTPDEEFSVKEINDVVKVHTKSGTKHLLIHWALFSYIPQHPETGAELIDVFPVAQFDQDDAYVKADNDLQIPPTLPNGNYDIKNCVRDFQSKDNHYNLVGKTIQDQIYIFCQNKIENSLDSLPKADDEPPDNPWK